MSGFLEGPAVPGFGDLSCQLCPCSKPRARSCKRDPACSRGTGELPGSGGQGIAASLGGSPAAPGPCLSLLTVRRAAEREVRAQNLGIGAGPGSGGTEALP